MELAVTKSGTLRLQSVPYEKVDRPPLIIAQETARFASLLLSHHTCIQELSLACSIRARSPFERPPFPIHISPTLSTLIHRRLRLLCITERANAHLDLRDIHTITGLETLIIRCEGHNQRITAEVDALLERNRTTLKNFDIWEFGQRREGLAMLEGLVACESLTFKANHNNGGMPYMDAMVSLMRVSTSLHEVVAQPIRDRELTLIAKALETNCTLSKLSLHIVQDCSIEQLFKALQLNKNLKELFLYGSVRMNVACSRAGASALENNDCLRTLSMEQVILEDGEGMMHWSEGLSKSRTLEFLCINCEHVSMNAVSRLCKALRVNKSLKELKLQGLDEWRGPYEQ
ncbi:hypothetical protein MTO96_037281, partial [Rhipicephalus appendiculatus]